MQSLHRFTPALALVAACSLLSQSKEVAELAVEGESRDLRTESAPRTAATERRPDLLVIAIDGVDRDLLYRMLRAGELPALARLLGGRGGDFAHAHFDPRLLTTLPSNTFTAWGALFTGRPPAVNGIPSNEFFIRAEGRFAAPGPVSFNDPTPAMKTLTDDYADDLLTAPTIYQQIRQHDPGARIWVSMSQFHAGADRLLTARRSLLIDAFRVFLDNTVTGKDDKGRMATYASVDREVLDTAAAKVNGIDDDEPLPDIFTIYLAGTDLFAHVAEAGPDRARRRYLTEVVDPGLERLRVAFARRGGLDDRYVVVISDHGHTPVMDDERHALGSRDDGEGPRDVLEAAGFRVRPFGWKVETDDFQAVLAFGGAVAFVYLADRTTCGADGASCDFRRPPRWREDVLAAADAFHRASHEGARIPAMRGTLDLVLVREGSDGPFRVYAGDGRVEDLDRHLARSPRDAYVDLVHRMRDLAVGPHGDRAGDILLLTRDGGEADIADRYYFSRTYRSWHGSPSRQDSEIPFILAHPKRSRRELAAVAGRALGDRPSIDRVGRLLVDLRLER
ncbi:MAG TPA: alkaline phosphatase family protein [Kofleriaceae bacterium]|nr:alkaline phosphatase family protein [Kofleriaceae bacterium]